MDELIQYFQSLLQYAEERGASLNPESQRALSDFIAQLSEIIESQMQQQQSPADGLTPTPPDIGNIQEAMPSSNVEGFAYDDETGQLMVRFLGQHPNRHGPVYSYGGVPREIFDMFQKGAVPARTNGKNKWGKWWKGKTPSIGASLYTLIKTRGYPYQRVA